TGNLSGRRIQTSGFGTLVLGRTPELLICSSEKKRIFPSTLSACWRSGRKFWISQDLLVRSVGS
ncbi:unnamed protein product, partial [Allacma fusca]